jgi:hypothetical protein
MFVAMGFFISQSASSGQLPIVAPVHLAEQIADDRIRGVERKVTSNRVPKAARFLSQRELPLFLGINIHDFGTGKTGIGYFAINDHG